MKKQSILLAFALAACGGAFAQAETPRIDARQERQEQRIEQGTASGRLTTKETARLDAQQSRIEAGEAAAKSDGKVTAKERVRLTHRQNKASARVYRNKHDRQKS